MESLMYMEMMHEIVTENDDLRQKVKEAKRKVRRQGNRNQNSQSNSGCGGSDASQCNESISDSGKSKFRNDNFRSNVSEDGTGEIIV
ncbi:hypothetical protein BX616_006478 [Lobosporangium transversale]|nr:hypothetical protein BX616_006478 [Lobosporangium transversale]